VAQNGRGNGESFIHFHIGQNSRKKSHPHQWQLLGKSSPAAKCAQIMRLGKMEIKI